MNSRRIAAQRASDPENTAGQAEYEIRLAGTLDPGWAEWFPAMMVETGISPVSPVTVIRGPVPDQSALRGILCKLWDLGLTVLRVERGLPAANERRQTT
jgi:hypothetical protein